MESGFSLAEVADMSIAQLNIYTTSILTRKKQSQLNNMNMLRVAFHAGQDEYADIVRDIERDT